VEHRDDGLLVDYSGNELQDSGRKQGRHAIVYDGKQEKELSTLDQETKLMRAMNEIRDYTPKSMSATEREMFNVLMESIFRKHGVTPEVYHAWFGHLGTPHTPQGPRKSGYYFLDGNSIRK
jgi:hypothetical protein